MILTDSDRLELIMRVLHEYRQWGDKIEAGAETTEWQKAKVKEWSRAVGMVFTAYYKIQDLMEKAESIEDAREIAAQWEGPGETEPRNNLQGQRMGGDGYVRKETA